MTQEMDEIETKHFQTPGLKYFHPVMIISISTFQPGAICMNPFTENIPGNGGEKVI